MRTINEIIIHCTATPEGKDYSVEQIRKWHLKRGWNDIGYHYVIHLDGTVEAGRPLSLPGAHDSSEFGVRSSELGREPVVVRSAESGERRPPTDSTLAKDESRLRACLEYAEAKQGHVHEYSLNIHGHNEYSMKRCPCFDV